jgi:hypothetical protein
MKIMLIRTTFTVELFWTGLCNVVFWRNLRICDFRINHKNLRICDLRTGTPKLADLQLAIAQEFVDLRFADIKKVSLTTCAGSVSAACCF